MSTPADCGQNGKFPQNLPPAGCGQNGKFPQNLPGGEKLKITRLSWTVMQSYDLITYLPEEVVEIIFDYLSAEELTALRAVRTAYIERVFEPLTRADGMDLNYCMMDSISSKSFRFMFNVRFNAFFDVDSVKKYDITLFAYGVSTDHEDGSTQRGHEIYRGQFDITADGKLEADKFNRWVPTKFEQKLLNKTFENVLVEVKKQSLCGVKLLSDF